MDAGLFAADLAQKPERLSALADVLGERDPWKRLGSSPVSDVIFVGMGSSHYASSVVAARLRSRGIRAVAELASADLLPIVGDDTVVVAVSASGGSRETLDAVDRLAGAGTLVVLTNSESSALSERAHLVVPLGAGVEVGGVACRSFQHTLALLLALEEHLAGGAGRATSALVRRCQAATADLLRREHEWLPAVTAALVGPDGSHLVAPARQLSSAQQAALMLREGPRLAAVPCETGDWAHVDVYLTKNTDYRLLLFGGSRWEDGLREWTDRRGTTVVTVGPASGPAAVAVRYPDDHDDDVRLLTETLVVELVAARLWQAAHRCS